MTTGRLHKGIGGWLEVARVASDDRDDRLGTGAGLRMLGRISEIRGDRMVGRTLGDYRIVGLIAEGGMSQVFRAERVDGSFDRDAAIKVSPIGAWNPVFAERFLREQKALAGLNHPNICQLFDAHVTEEGWPYIVMELIDGEPSRLYCESHGTAADDRVRMLCDVADAVSYAHARLVVHRDIKPSNVLVDDSGRPRVIDFGIAKLLSDEAQAVTGAMPMTPRYASPEQLLDQPISIASDIYQLGLLMFEVLIGTPLVTDDVLATSVRRAAEQRPLRIPARARDRLPRELMLIIEQCLRVRPEERYRDAGSLAEDLRAWLEGFPVSAAGQGAGYRFRKLLARNKSTAAISLAAGMTLVSGAAWYTSELDAARAEAERQAELARLEAEESSRVSDFMVELLAAGAPNNAQGEPISVREVLDRGVLQIEAGLQDQPELKSSLLLTIGRTYLDLGFHENAAPLIEQSISLRESGGLMARAEALHERCRVLESRAEFDAAEACFLEVLFISRNGEAPERAWEAAPLEGLGNVAFGRDQRRIAKQYFTAALDALEAAGDQSSLQQITLRYNLAVLEGGFGNYEAELAVVQELIQVVEERYGVYHSSYLTMAAELGWLMQTMGRYEEAEQWVLRALASAEHLYGEGHGWLARYLGQLATIYVDLDRLDEAEAPLLQAIEYRRTLYGDLHSDTGFSRLQLAFAYVDLDRYEDAERQLQLARQAFDATLPEVHQYVADWHLAAAGLAEKRGNLEVAIDQLDKTKQIYLPLYGEDHMAVSDAEVQLGRVFAALGRFGESAKAFARGLPIRARVRGWQDKGVIELSGRYIDVLTELGRMEEVQKLRAQLGAGR